MKYIIQDLDEITDSREMLEAKPHRFTSIFTYVLILLLISALTWSYFGKIDIVVKTSGVVKSTDKTVSILNEIEGKVDEVDFKEGQEVQEGDILYTLECKDAVLNKDNYENQMEIIKKDTDNMKKLKQSIVEDTNYFDNNNPDEKDYYNKYLQYQINKNNLSLTQSGSKLESEINNSNKISSSDSLAKQIGQNNDMIDSLNTLLKSINEDKNNFDDNQGMYSLEYLDYKFTIENLINTIEQKKIELQNSKNKYEQDMQEYENEMSAAKITYKNYLLKLEEYKTEYIAQIESSLKDANDSLKDIKYTTTTTNTQKDQIEESIDNLELLIDSINEDENLFSDEDSSYYQQYVDYTNNLQTYATEEEKQTYTNSYIMKLNQSIDSNKSKLSQLEDDDSNSLKKKNGIKDEISNLEKLEECINDDTNYFDESETEYYSKFLNYKNNITELQNNIDSQKNSISNLEEKRNSIVDEYNNEISSTQKVLENAENDLSQYQNKSALDIKSKLDEADKSGDKIKSELEQVKVTPELDNINDQIAGNNLTKNKIETLVSLSDNIKQNTDKINDLESQIENLQLTIDKSTVKASIDGVINIKNDIAKGQLLQTGQEIVTVIPKDDSSYKVQLYVSNKDIANMKIGEKIKYHFDALPYKEYGELNGEITDIAVDSSIDTRSGLSYYIVESEIKNEPLFSYKGEKGELKMGMTCDAQVITKQKKILYYLLEKIKLKK